MGELFGNIMENRLKDHLANERKQETLGANGNVGMDMSNLLNAVKQLQINHSDIDLLRDIPGYEEFSKASDAEYEEQDFKKARLLYEIACRKGHPLALTNFALWFLDGRRPGSPKNLNKAFKMFEQAAKHNIGMAQYNLALFYYTAKGGVVREDLEKAYSLVREAIKDQRVTQMKQGEPFYMIGSLLLEGKGCKKNSVKAKKYYETARELGDPRVTDDLMKCLNLYTQVDPNERQRETDRRWDRMVAYGKAHPEEKQETVGQHLAHVRRFGFDTKTEPSSRELNIRGGFNKFLEVIGGSLHTTEHYEMEDEPTPSKICGHCGENDAKRRCAKCGEPYCSKPCQKADWKTHKKICAAVQCAQAGGSRSDVEHVSQAASDSDDDI